MHIQIRGELQQKDWTLIPNTKVNIENKIPWAFKKKSGLSASVLKTTIRMRWLLLQTYIDISYMIYQWYPSKISS